MALKHVLLLLVIPAAFAGCWLDEARTPPGRSLRIVADRLSAEDSVVIRDYAKARKVDVSIEVLGPEAILDRVRSKRYNADIDVLITEDESLRNRLQDLKVLKTIRDERHFSRLERQFNNQHHQWVPVSHDPLVLSVYKDSGDYCRKVDFRNWHRDDSLLPQLAVRQHRTTYTGLLERSTHFRWITAGGKRRPSGEEIHALSELVDMENAADSVYRSYMNRCHFYLVDRQRYISRVATISLYRHGRNSAEAERFLAHFAAHAYAVANGRNQLPTRKNVSPNWYIRSLSVR